MQFEKAKSLREKWGDIPCTHPNIEKEYYLGSHTMDYVCSTCGEEFTKTEKQLIDDKRSDKTN